MLRGVILLSFILITTAKYHKNDIPDILKNENELNGAFEDISSEPGITSKQVWVVKMRNGWDDVIEPASAEEVQEFEEANGPLLERYLRRRSPNRARNATAKLDENLTVGKEDIFKLINKFAMHSNVDPDTYLTNEEDTNSIALYIRSPHAFLVINVGNKQWHFSVVNLPTPLPSWFYEDHKGTSATAIPKELKQPFYLSVWRLLNVLGFSIY